MSKDRDRLPRWLFERYSGRSDVDWAELDEGDRIRWQEEADTVIRAVITLALYRIVPR